MSAFILEPKQFAEIRTGLERIQHEQGYDEMRRVLSRVCMTHEHSIEKLVLEWVRLNIEAVKQRYETQDMEGYEIAKDFKLTGGADKVRMTPPSTLKHLECLHYQMSEGDITETDDYKGLGDIITALQRNIAEQSIDFISTPWGSAIG